MNSWKGFWIWWLRKIISTLVSYSAWGIALLVWLLIHKHISDVVFQICFLGVYGQRAGKDIYEIWKNNKNNKNANSSQEGKE